MLDADRSPNAVSAVHAGTSSVRQECERQKCERHQCEANSANANSAKGSTVRMRQECECQMCECQQCDATSVRKKCDSSANANSANRIFLREVRSVRESSASPSIYLSAAFTSPSKKLKVFWMMEKIMVNKYLFVCHVG